jgi:hypothetical protein
MYYFPYPTLHKLYVYITYIAYITYITYITKPNLTLSYLSITYHLRWAPSPCGGWAVNLGSSRVDNISIFQHFVLRHFGLRQMHAYPSRRWHDS